MSKAKEQALKKTTEAVKKPAANEKLNVFQRMSRWFRELKSELKKVVWPTRQQTQNNTLVALAVMIVLAVILWGFDTVAQAAVHALIRLAG